MKVVLDTNVWVSAYLNPRGIGLCLPPSAAVSAGRRRPLRHLLLLAASASAGGAGFCWLPAASASAWVQDNSSLTVRVITPIAAW